MADAKQSEAKLNAEAEAKLKAESNAKKAKAEAVYQQYLLEKAVQKAEKQADESKLCFDPSGCAVLQVTLDAKDYMEIVHRIDPRIENGTKAQLFALIGGPEPRRVLSSPASMLQAQLSADQPRELTDTVNCKIDVKQNDALRDAFLKWFEKQEEKKAAPARKEEPEEKKRLVRSPVLSKTPFGAFIRSPSRFSVINLQSEMFHHMSLMLRGLAKKDSKLISAEEFTAILDAAALQINVEVQKIFKRALEKSTQANEIDYAKLNKELDKARKKLAKTARETLINECFAKLDAAKQDRLCGVISRLTDQDFTGTTATGNDYFATDTNAGLSVRIDATEATAHKKTAGSLAFRPVHVCRLEDKAKIVPLSTMVRQARVPSLFAVDEKGDADLVKDSVSKIRSIVAGLNPPGATIYNLLTSLYRVGDSNQQTESAEMVLEAMHRFNAEQVASHPNKLFLVCNIPNNRHGAGIDHASWNTVIAESTLMAELAIIDVLRQNSQLLSADEDEAIESLSEEGSDWYRKYLSKGESKYFSESTQGGKLRDLLDEYRAAAPTLQNQADAKLSFEQTVVRSLCRMFHADQFRDQEYGTLVQTLINFSAQVSVIGCKSGNERTAMVQNRELLLRSIAEKLNHNVSLEESETAVVDAFLSYANHVTSDPSEINGALDRLYNERNVNGMLGAISYEDQGAASKVGVKPGFHFSAWDILLITLLIHAIYHFFADFNTNRAESELSNLATDKAASMQAHKVRFDKAWKSSPQYQAYLESHAARGKQSSKSREATLQDSVEERAALLLKDADTQAKLSEMQVAQMNAQLKNEAYLGENTQVQTPEVKVK